MQDFPHHYQATATAAEEGDVPLASAGLPEIASAPPVEFGGPGNRWSPETLLVAAVADCFVLSFRAIARASRLTWLGLQCDVTGTLERVERVTRFTRFEVNVRLTVPPGTDRERALKLLEKAEQTCLITNSLSATTHLQAEVTAPG
ncbi:MAG: OsmC family protein [Gammaproteobacteria bacterium]|nr:OsmC family protein [Gammaproteobacteria bacterium]